MVYSYRSDRPQTVALEAMVSVAGPYQCLQIMNWFNSITSKACAPLGLPGTLSRFREWEITTHCGNAPGVIGIGRGEETELRDRLSIRDKSFKPETGVLGESVFPLCISDIAKTLS